MAVMSCSRESAAGGETASDANAVMEEVRTNASQVRRICETRDNQRKGFGDLPEGS